ncbi:NAD-dependent epimerase/dehydratase family protein [Pararhodospirillum oryzae]|uniref:NAD-dependent epimerase/dehydratase domain-containing protein n=1 Tax=Pararhodospirillum oryzae TaxID=478448 RepID=A0A512H5E3_9PROT|nr:NAD-dependent epimerase/dehydratase family protein [Pararhodospirillum oryzae]GEO80653.1 hypothetical protein ROR02_07840 [Pararhodospirillum oryzae]
MPTILVTGAGGFLGSRIARFLASRPQTTVRAGIHGGGRPAPEGAGLTPVIADVRDIRTLDVACEGVDAIVHCATGDRWVTVNGTQAVLTAARQHKVPRVVVLSSVVVYGQAAGEVSEDTPLDPMADDPEALLKAEAESLCRQAMAEGQSVIVLRLPILFGAECPQWAGTTARRLASRRWGTLGDAGEGVCNPLDPRDLVEAVAAAIEARPGLAGAYNIRGPETLTWNAFFERFNEALGLPALVEQNLNGFGLRFLMGTLVRETVGRLPQAQPAAGAVMTETPTFRELDFFRLSATYPIDRAQADLGWRPGVSLDDSLAAAAAWAKAGGMAELRQPVARVVAPAAEAGEGAAPGADGPVSLMGWSPSFLQTETFRALLPPQGAKGSGASAGAQTEGNADSGSDLDKVPEGLSSKLFPAHIIFKPMPDEGPTVSVAETMSEIKDSFAAIDNFGASVKRRLGGLVGRAGERSSALSGDGAEAPKPGTSDEALSRKLFPAHIIFKQMPENGPTVSVSETWAEINKSLPMGKAKSKAGEEGAAGAEPENPMAARDLARKMFPAHIIFKKAQGREPGQE